MELVTLIFIASIFILSIAGLIPASIAKSKGYSFLLWWIYGSFLFVIALIHIVLMPNKNLRQVSYNRNNNNNLPSGQSAADELKKFKDLYDQGVITEEEFLEKKEMLIKLL